MKKRTVIFLICLFLVIVASIFLSWSGFLWLALLSLILLAGVVVGLVALARRRRVKHWFTNLGGLAAIFIIGLVIDHLKPYPGIEEDGAGATDVLLEHLYDSDQYDRKRLRTYLGNKAFVRSRDSIRLQKVQELAGKQSIVTPHSKYYSAMIMHHGHLPEHFETAHQLASEAYQADSSLPNAGWLVKATYDRWQISLGKSQKYGTQMQRR